MWLGLLAVVCMLPACFNSGVRPRTGELPRPDMWVMQVNYTVVSGAPGEVALGDGRTDTGNTAQREHPHPLGYLLLPYFSATIGVGYTFTDWFYLAIDGGMQQLSLDARFQVADEYRGSDPFSATIDVRGAWRPWNDVLLPWTSVGIAASKRFSSGVAPFLNIDVSFGPEDHAMLIHEDLSSSCGGFGDEGCGEFGPPRQYDIHRSELRLHIPVGISIGEPTPVHVNGNLQGEYNVFEEADIAGYEMPQGEFTLAITPYVVLYAAEAETLGCTGCSYLDVQNLRESWGMSLTVGGTLY